jgi:hypothetical protein
MKSQYAKIAQTTILDLSNMRYVVAYSIAKVELALNFSHILFLRIYQSISILYLYNFLDY